MVKITGSLNGFIITYYVTPDKIQYIEEFNNSWTVKLANLDALIYLEVEQGTNLIKQLMG